MEKLRVALQATDPLTHEGLASYVRSRPEMILLRAVEHTEAEVLIVSVERLTTDAVAMLRRAVTEVGVPVVLITNEINEAELLIAVECRVVAILPRPAVTADRFAYTVLAAAKGDGVMPPKLVGGLLRHIERMQRDVLAPNGLNAAGLTPREVDVLRLMADGLDTNEIASKLAYSERTIKNIIYSVLHRLNLRNRSHAVAYALRSGLICRGSPSPSGRPTLNCDRAHPTRVGTRCVVPTLAAVVVRGGDARDVSRRVRCAAAKNSGPSMRYASALHPGGQGLSRQGSPVRCPSTRRREQRPEPIGYPAGTF